MLLPIVLFEVVGDDLEGSTFLVLNHRASCLLIHILICDAKLCGVHSIIISCLRRVALLRHFRIRVKCRVTTAIRESEVLRLSIRRLDPQGSLVTRGVHGHRFTIAGAAWHVHYLALDKRCLR